MRTFKKAAEMALAVLLPKETDQPRDENGRFASGDGGGKTGPTGDRHLDAAGIHHEDLRPHFSPSDTPQAMARKLARSEAGRQAAGMVSIASTDNQSFRDTHRDMSDEGKAALLRELRARDALPKGPRKMTATDLLEGVRRHVMNHANEHQYRGQGTPENFSHSDAFKKLVH